MSATGASRGRRGLALDQVVAGDDVGDARRAASRAGAAPSRARRRIACSLEIEVDQAVGVVERRPEHLAAGQVLEGRRDAAAQRHRRGVDRFGEAEARQRGAIGAHQEDRLDQVAARLLDRQRRDARGRRASPRSSRDRRRARAARRSARSSISGVARSPRRRSASSAWALRIARSPPLTATYISASA